MVRLRQLGTFMKKANMSILIKQKLVNIYHTRLKFITRQLFSSNLITLNIAALFSLGVRLKRLNPT